MGPIQRAVRRALNPISTRVTMLVHGVGTRRAVGIRRDAARPRSGMCSGAGSAVAARGQPLIRRRILRAREVPAARLLSGQVAVPDVIGLGWEDAIAVLRTVGLVAVGPDPDGPPLAAVGWPGGVVVDQHPEPGAILPVGSPVTVWVERSPGSAGVREPRRPTPELRSASGMMDEETDEAVG